jgi:hypothetical protein
MVEPEQVTKLEAADHQLRMAIRLFFNRDDMVAIHTLTAAASQILRDLAGRIGSTSPFRDAEIIRPEKKQEWFQVLTRAQNFFKHADRDPEDVLDFFPNATPFLIFEAVLMHNELTKAYVPETLVFAAWFNLKHPNVLLEGPMKTVIQGALAQGLDPDDFGVLRAALEFVSGQAPKS